jgi:hypothetical protein
MRTIAKLLVACGLLALLADLLRFFETAVVNTTLVGELWYRTHPPSLNLFQAIVERYVSVNLWNYVFAEVLLWPLWILLSGLGIALWIFCRWIYAKQRPIRQDEKSQFDV